MSFILDALRKSENSRLRQDHPAIFTTPLAGQRRKLARWWVPVLAALLAINLLFIGYALWRDRPAAASPTAALPDAAPPAAATPAGTIPVAVSASAMPTAASPAPARAASASSVTSARVRSAPVAITSTADAAPRVTRDDLLARGSSIPPAELNMHVYDPNPSARFVLLNGQRLREGEAARDGLLVERITPQGVVLRFGDASFAVNLQ